MSDKGQSKVLVTGKTTPPEQPVDFSRKRRIHEDAIRALLFAFAGVSILTTIGIVVILGRESWLFFGDPEVTLEPDATHAADGYATSELRTGTHAGTHVDAPRHTLPDGAAIDETDPGRFAFDARLVDLRPLEPREPITAEALSAALGDESEPDAVESAVDLLVLRTGWATRWGTERYRDHPYLTETAARWVRDRDAGVGLDAFGPDPTPAAPSVEGAGAAPPPSASGNGRSRSARTSVPAQPHSSAKATR